MNTLDIVILSSSISYLLGIRNEANVSPKITRFAFQTKKDPRQLEHLEGYRVAWRKRSHFNGNWVVTSTTLEPSFVNHPS